MARRKSEAQASETPAEAAAPAKAHKSRNNLIPAVVLAVGLAAAGYFFSSGKGGGTASAAPATPVATTPTTVAEGDIVKLDATTLNLADGRFLKIGIGLQLKKGIKPEEYTTKSAKALDLAITLFGSKTYAQLADPAARSAAKDQLSADVVKAYDGEVTRVYFTEFVMQ
jgi:flagellar FliL protein